MLTCPSCNGEIRPGAATVTLERDGSTIVVKGVPAEVCENCGEEFVSEETARRVTDLGETAIRSGVEVDVRHFAAGP
jgi:YgiT-type zinc finger domain-containing protein